MQPQMIAMAKSGMLSAMARKEPHQCHVSRTVAVSFMGIFVVFRHTTPEWIGNVTHSKQPNTRWEKAKHPSVSRPAMVVRRKSTKTSKCLAT